MKSHYDTLGISPNALPEVVKAAYRAMSQKYHPDINSGDAQATITMAAINRAYEVLSSPEKRASYDKELKLGEMRNRGAIDYPGPMSPDATEADTIYHRAVEIILEHRRASISLIQRHLRIGYNDAAALLERMEEAGIVSAMRSNGNRDILVDERGGIEREDDMEFDVPESQKSEPLDEERPRELMVPKRVSYFGPVEYVAIVLFTLITVFMIFTHEI